MKTFFTQKSLLFLFFLMLSSFAIQAQVISCNDINVGTTTSFDDIVCFGDTTNFSIEGVVIPNEPDSVNGYRWIISTVDLSGVSDPAGATGYLGAFGASATPYTPLFINNGTQLRPDIFVYFTPVVYAGAIDTVGNGFFGSLDFSQGCIEVGTSLLVRFGGQNPITATSITTPVTETNPPNGTAVILPSGGSGLYAYAWPGGQASDTVRGLAVGDYDVTILDRGNCADPFVITVSVTADVISCDDISAGVVPSYNSIVCFGDETLFEIDSTVIPNNESGITGFRWLISTTDITGSIDPGGDPGYFGAFGELTTPYTPTFLNDTTVIRGNVFVYFTPVVYAGAVDTVGNGRLESLDFSGGCISTGPSQLVFLSGDNGPITANSNSLSATSNNPFNGEAGIELTGGGSFFYNINWDTGETTDTISGLEPGDYMVTISDAGDCADDLVITVTVQDSITVGTFSPEFEAAIKLYPNPAQTWVNFDFDFESTTDLQLELSTSTGQMIRSIEIDDARRGSQRLEVSDLPTGVYLLQIRDQQNFMTKRIMIE